MTERVIPEGSRIRFECATHRVALAALEGPPVLIPFEPMGTGWQFDLTAFGCPTGADLAGRDIDEGCQFRVWVKEP